MDMKKILIAMVLAVFCYADLYADDDVVVYPIPKGIELNKDFTVEVRQGNGRWKIVDTYSIKVKDNMNNKVEIASMAYFDFSGDVEIAVTFNKEEVNRCRIRPLSHNIKSVISGRTVYFKLDNPCNLSIEINDDIFHNLHLFANPIEKNIPNKKSKNVIYFAPGIHYIPSDTLFVSSGKTVYIAGGAVVKGCLHVRNVHNVKILGHGIISPKGRDEGVYISNSRNVEVDGLITTQCPTGGSDRVKIKNVKVISSYGWGDGLNVFASNNVLYDGVFCRTSDDCTTVYATRKGFSGGCHNIEMKNSTLWADVAHPIFIGLHGNVEQPDTIDSVLYKNIDILDQCERQIDYQGCMAIAAGDNNLVKNICFDNIRIEDIRKGQLVSLRVSFNHKYCKAPGKGIENVLFRNISYNGNNAEVSIIAGYDDTRKIKNVHFENLSINGRVISDDMRDKPKWYKTADFARFFIGEHVDDIDFKR